MNFASERIDRFLLSLKSAGRYKSPWSTEVMWERSGESISPMKTLMIRDVRGRNRTVLLQLRLANMANPYLGKWSTREEIYREMKKQDPSEELSESWQDRRKLLDRIFRRDAAGVIDIYIHPEKKTADGKDRYSWEHIRSAHYLSHLQSVLEHELTHAMEITQDLAIASVPSVYTWFKGCQDVLGSIDDPAISQSERLELIKSFKLGIKRRTEYWNRYQEIRAYMKNIVSEIIPILRLRALDYTPESSRPESIERDLSYALSQSETWNAIDPVLGQKSRNILLKGIVTALEDEGIITIE